MSTTPSHETIPQGEDAVWMHHTELSPWADNPNLHPQFQPEAVAESIRAFGFVAPACIWKDQSRLVAGHGRLEAMRLICETGYDYIDSVGEIQHRDPDPGFVPIGAPEAGYMRVIYHNFPSEAVANAYALADNELARAAKMDEAAARKLLKAADADESFNALHAIGLDHVRLQELIADVDNTTFLHNLTNPPGGGENNPPGPGGGDGGGGGGEGGGSTTRKTTLVDMVTPMSVAERASAHGVINLAKRVTGVTTQREAILAIFKHYEESHTKPTE